MTAASLLVRRVMIDPFAIGIASYAEKGAARVLTLTGPCGFFLQAGRRAVKTEDYPLTVPMFLYLPARRLPKVARDFLAYVARTGSAGSDPPCRICGSGSRTDPGQPSRQPAC